MTIPNQTPSSRCILLPLSASGKRRAKTSLRQPLKESALMLEAIRQSVAWHRPSGPLENQMWLENHSVKPRSSWGKYLYKWPIVHCHVPEGVVNPTLVIINIYIIQRGKTMAASTFGNIGSSSSPEDLAIRGKWHWDQGLWWCFRCDWEGWSDHHFADWRSPEAASGATFTRSWPEIDQCGWGLMIGSFR